MEVGETGKTVEGKAEKLVVVRHLRWAVIDSGTVWAEKGERWWECSSWRQVEKAGYRIGDRLLVRMHHGRLK